MDDNYRALADAIVIQAVKDYREALHVLSCCPGDRIIQQECRTIEKFFRSPWFNLLTNVNPDVLIKKLKEEVRNEG